MEKNTTWIWRAIDGVSRKPLRRQLGDRSDACLEKLVRKVDTEKCDFVPDERSGFFRVLPKERHFFEKDLTFPIEASNSEIELQGSTADLKLPPGAWLW